MSDHGDHATGERDVTDFYTFRSPNDPERSVLVMNVNPGAVGSSFDATARYELMVDMDMDARTDRRFETVFSAPLDGWQIATVCLVVEGEAPRTLIQNAPVSFSSQPSVTETDMIVFFAGLRSDQLFVDAAGVFDNFIWTGQDSTSTANVFSIVLELPNGRLGAKRVGLWARVMIPHGDGELQADRPGSRSPMACSTSTIQRDRTSSISPIRRSTARTSSTGSWRFCTGRDLHPEQAADIVTARLPDIPPYDATMGTAFPNGRALSDDIADATWAPMTNGAATDDGIGQYKDLLPHFPWLGPPHAPVASGS